MVRCGRTSTVRCAGSCMVGRGGTCMVGWGGSCMVGRGGSCMVRCGGTCMVSHSGRHVVGHGGICVAWPGSFLGFSDPGGCRSLCTSQAPYSIRPSIRPPKAPPDLQGCHPGSPPASPVARGMLLAPSRHPGQQKGPTLPGPPCSGLAAVSPRDRTGDSPPPQQPHPASSLPWLLLAPAPRPLSFPKSRSGILWPVFMAIMNMVKINACIFNVSINKGKQSLLLT